MLALLTVLAHVLLIGPAPASAQERADTPEVFVDEDESASDPRDAIDLRVSLDDVAHEQPSRPWYERVWVWALFGSAIATTAFLAVIAVVAATAPPSMAEEFCASGGCIRANLNL